jgi:hypothetical protein
LALCDSAEQDRPEAPYVGRQLQVLELTREDVHPHQLFHVRQVSLPQHTRDDERIVPIHLCVGIEILEQLREVPLMVDGLLVGGHADARRL